MGKGKEVRCGKGKGNIHDIHEIKIHDYTSGHHSLYHKTHQHDLFCLSDT